MGVYIVVGVIYSIICGAIASSIASNRGMEGGFGWGFFLGIIGVIVVALRPSDRAASAYSESAPPAQPKVQIDDAPKVSGTKTQTPRKTVVFSLPNDLYATGSPVILASGSLLKDRQTDAMSVRVTLQNIGPKPIIAAQIRVRPMDAAGRVLGEDIRCHYLDLNVKTGESFGGNKEFSLPDSTTREISVEVSEVIFSDKTVWQSEEEPWEPLPSPEPLSRRLGDPELVKQYRIRFGSDCQLWPRAHKDLWLCACGTWNRDDGCYRCQREGAALLALDPEELMAEKDARLAREKADREAKEAAQRAAAEKAAAEAAAREAAAKAAAEKRKRRNRRIALTFVLMAALGVGGYFLWTDVIQPYQQYKEAVALYGTGRYQEAIAAFEALDGYKDSAAQIENCETAIKDAAYDTAVELHNAGKYEEAIAAFEALKGYRDSADQIANSETAIQDAAYDAAAALYNAGKYEEAIVAFEALNGYRDSADQIINCETASKDEKYAAAVELYNDGKYEDAVAGFRALNGYKDSTEKIDIIKHSAKWITVCPVGETVFFGSYEQDNNTSNGKEVIEWIVLDKKDNRLLLISRFGLDTKPYHSSNTPVTWEQCTLREWLNEGLFKTAFTEAEQNSIPLVRVAAQQNPEYNTLAGNSTNDRVFLLSIREVETYFISNKDRSCEGTKYELAQEENLAKGKLKSWSRGWWLRSPGDKTNMAGYVGECSGSIENGKIIIDSSYNDAGVASITGLYVSATHIMVRPAMWIGLD